MTIVTWYPDAYKYGRDDARMELMERLRKAGFEIRLAEDSCEHYAVIDDEIVWYGSVNLLSKEDADYWYWMHNARCLAGAGSCGS